MTHLVASNPQFKKYCPKYYYSGSMPNATPFPNDAPASAPSAIHNSGSAILPTTFPRCRPPPLPIQRVEKEAMEAKGWTEMDNPSHLPQATISVGLTCGLSLGKDHPQGLEVGNRCLDIAWTDVCRTVFLRFPSIQISCKQEKKITSLKVDAQKPAIAKRCTGSDITRSGIYDY